jgi:hypothetical protein
MPVMMGISHMKNIPVKGTPTVGCGATWQSEFWNVYISKAGVLVQLCCYTFGKLLHEAAFCRSAAACTPIFS